MSKNFDPRWLELNFLGGIISVGSDEPQHFVYETSGTIGVLDDEDAPTEVGTFKVIYVDIDAANNAGVGYFDVLDSCSETAAYLELFDEEGDYTQAALAAASEDCCFEPNLLILDRLTIHPEYRGHNIGLATLSALMQRFSAGAGMVAMKPFPLQFEANSPHEEENEALKLDAFSKNKRTATRKLCRYYGQLGFQRVKGTELMVLCTSQMYPDASFLLARKTKRGAAMEQVG